MAHQYTYRPRFVCSRKPNLDGLFDEKTPPLVIRKPRRDYALERIGTRPKQRPKQS